MYTIIKEEKPMNFFELMESKKTAFSKTERVIYELIKKNPQDYANSSLTVLCDTNRFTKPALVRFAQKLGFSGFTEMQFKLQQDLKEYSKSSQTKSGAEFYSGILQEAERSLSPKVIQQVVDKLKHAHAIYTMGVHLSHLPAEELLLILHHSMDTPAFCPTQDQIPVRFHSGDVVVIFSAISGGFHGTFLKRFRDNKEGKPYLILVTVNSKHPLRHNFDMVITLPSGGPADSASIVLSDTFAFMMFNDMVMRALGRSEE